MQFSTYHDFLAHELERRQASNKAYSLRAYARDLDLSPSRLSQVLNKKQGLSFEVAEDIARKLNLTEAKKEWFCHSVGAQHARSSKERDNFKERIQKYQSEARIHSEIQLEYFKVISDWYHFAILELTYLESFENRPEWIADILGISEGQAESAIERMKSLGLMKEENGKLVDTFKFLATPSDVPSESLRKFNRQLMELATNALEEQDVHNREIASNIFSIDKENIPVFKEKLRTFRRELEHEASKSKKKDAVYCLGMQFFELTRNS